MEEKPEEQPAGSATPKAMSMARRILIGLVVVIAIVVVGFIALVMMQSEEFHVSRSTTINAPPEDVFPHVNNFHNWNAWSPWAELDPNAEYSFPGPDSGEGAEYHWDGNDDVGAGFMKIVESKPDERVRYELTFIRPYEDKCEVEVQLQREGESTKVTWEMDGQNDNFTAKMMCLFMDVEAMVGKDFEKGLAKLKQVAEQDAADATDDPAGDGDQQDET